MESAPLCIRLLIYLILIITFVVTPICLIWIMILNRKIKRPHSSKSFAEEVAERVLEEARWPGKQNWLDDEKMEIVSIICGQVPGERKVWIRTFVSKTGMLFTIEYWYTVTASEMQLATNVAEYLKRREFQVSLQAARRQPTEDEIFVRERRDKDEDEYPKDDDYNDQ